MTTTRYYPGEQITLYYTTYSNGVKTTPTSITFKYRLGKLGSDKTVTPALVETGVHSVTFTPDKDTLEPVVHYRWETTSPTTVEEGHVRLRKSVFATGTVDYV